MTGVRRIGRVSGRPAGRSENSAAVPASGGRCDEAVGAAPGARWHEIRVAHTPAPQGSKVGFVRKGGGAGTREANRNTEPYRQAVRHAVEDYIEDHDGWRVLDGPLEVEAYFTMPKPASAPKTKQTWPDKKPDIDKLLRSTFDALTAAGFWKDDARVVKLRNVEKCFPGEHPYSFSATGTGAVIRVRPLCAE